MCLAVMALVETARGNNARAMRVIQENLRLARGTDDKISIHYSLVALGGVALGFGDPARAAQLWGATEALRESFGMRFTPMTRALMRYEDLLAVVRDRLGETTFEEAWSEGKAMTQAQAIDYAFAEAPVPVPGEPSASLTRREEEIASLIAKGLTNRRIASELSISERTVDTHVGRTLKKLNLRSREQIATCMSELWGDPGTKVAREEEP